MVNNNIPMIDLAYIAGFIDGEGCLHIYKLKIGGNRKTISYGTKIVISNTKLPILEWIQSLFGGFIQKVLRSNENEKWADSYLLHIQTKDSYKLLSLVYPYLKLKKSQADIFFKFLKLRESFSTRTNPNGVGTLPSCNEYLELQEKYYQDNKRLNMRGINDKTR